MDVRKTNLSSSDEEHGQQYHYKSGGRKDSLLHVDTPPVDSDAADHQAVKEHMQRLNNLGTYKCIYQRLFLIFGIS